MRRLALSSVAVLVMALTTAPAAGAAGWTVQPVPNGTAPQGTLSSVSCTSATACTAVGSTIDGAGTSVSLPERWDGSSWTVQQPAVPAGATSGGLEGVSCTSATRCVAVGHYVDSAGTAQLLAETWNGSAWSVQAVPRPAGGTAPRLTAVSCTSATACTAVGNYQSSGNTHPLVERWNGSSWTIQATPDISSGFDFLNGISCTTASDCIAVGSAGDHPLIERWDGTSWTIQSTPSLPLGNGALYGVSCTSPTACTAVGYTRDLSGQYEALAERWDGAGWTIQSTPNPAGGSFVYLRSVSCTTASACTAVGFYANGANSVTLAEVWDGTGWTVQSTPNPGPTFVDSRFFGVSCGAASACIAVGQSVGDTWTTLAAKWDGSGWTSLAARNPAGAIRTSLLGVSCSTASHCIGVGFYDDPSDIPLAEAWDGSWKMQSAAIPAGAERSLLWDVSCPSPTACVAVGSYDDSAGGKHTLAEVWNGSSWSVLPPASPAPGHDRVLRSVSCTSPTMCIAVGNYIDDAGNTASLVERWNGTSWSLEQSDDPAGSSDTELSGVSCSSADDCTAVGFSGTSLLSGAPFAEARSSAGWVAQDVPLPAGASGGGLFRVSCSAAAACIATGFGPFAERWDGSNWTAQEMASPSTTAAVGPFGVSCASATHCVAAGRYNDFGVDAAALIEVWNGASWTIQPSPNPPGARASALIGVSCPTTVDCEAVGDWWGTGFDGGDGTIVALAEGYHPAPVKTPTSLTAAPQLVIFPPPTGVGLGRVSATLSSGGSPVAGRTISFGSAGIPLCTAVTGAKGTASCRLSFRAELVVLFSNRYSASFSGDANYLASAASTPAIVLGQGGPTAQASAAAHRRVSIVQGAITRRGVRYAVLVRHRSAGVTRLGFRPVRRIGPGRYSLRLTLTGGRHVRKTISLIQSRRRYRP